MRWPYYLGHLYMFHANPWVHVRLGQGGGLVEKKNDFNTPESLRNLSNLDYVYEHFKDDLVVNLLAAQAGVVSLRPYRRPSSAAADPLGRSRA